MRRTLGGSSFSGRRRWDPVLIVGLVALIAGSVQCFRGASETGITTDEPTQLARTQSWLSDGRYVPPIFFVDGEPTDDPAASPYVYSPAFATLGHTLNVILGEEDRGNVSSSQNAWTVRHLLVASIGVFTALIAGVAVFLLSGSIRFGLWGAAALLAIPLWTGMSFFNVKDVPAAAGYTFFTTGLILAVRLSDTSLSKPRQAGIAAF